MLDKNDKKYIIRRIITYLAIAMIMFVISSCQAKAATGGPSGYNDIWVNNSRYNKGGNLQQFNGTTYYTVTTGRDNVDMIQIAIDNLSGTQVPTDITFNVLMYGAIWNPQVNINEYQSKQFGQSCTIVSENHYNATTDYTQYELNVKCEGIALYKNYLVSISGGTFVYGGISPTITYVPSNNNTEVNQNITNVNNSLNDDTPPSNNEISGNTNDWSSYNIDNGVINNLVLMPITLLNSFVNGMNNTCSSYDFGELWGEHLILPCIDLSQMLGTVWSIIDIILSGVFIYIFGKQCVKIFNDFTNLRSGQIDTLYGGGN